MVQKQRYPLNNKGLEPIGDELVIVKELIASVGTGNTYKPDYYWQFPVLSYACLFLKFDTKVEMN